MKILTIALLLSAVSPALAQADWTTAKTADLNQMDQVRYAQLLPAEKTALQTLTAPALQQCVTADPKFDVADAFQHIRVRRTELGEGTPGFVVEGTGCLCTPQANCTFWIVTADMQTLFQGNAQTFALLPQTTAGRYDLVTASHISTTQSTRAFYKFDGTQYQATQCAAVSLSNAFGSVQMKPSITIQKCQ